MHIDWCGRRWGLKHSDEPVGPGPNLFSAAPGSVRIDHLGRLCLAIRFFMGGWRCAEVFTVEPLGYGTFTFVIASPVEALDPNMVLGLFTWDSAAPHEHYREIDIEFSRWGDPQSANAQFVVQPWDAAGHVRRYAFDSCGRQTVHLFRWTPHSVQFRSVVGVSQMSAESPPEAQSWCFQSEGIPREGRARVHLNLWLAGGRPPQGQQEAEVLIESFAHSPLGASE